METLRYVVLVNALLAVVSFAYYVLLRRETFFRTNRLVLWLGVGATLLLPLLELPDWRPQPVRAVMHRTAQVIVPKILSKVGTPKPEVTITFPNQRTYPAFQNQYADAGWSWPMLLLLLYTGGVLLLLIRLGVQLSSLRLLIRQSVHESYGDFMLVRNDTVTAPFSFFKWVVLNPDRHTSDELEQILRHERVHVRERHSLDMLGAEVICIFFWFNPAAYLFRHLLHQTLEFSADQTVLAEGVDARAYQYNLVKVSLSAGQSAITNHFSKSQIKSRISMLNRPASSKATWLKYPVFFITALTIASAFARPQVIRLSRHLPIPLATGIQAVLKTPTPVAEPLKESEPSVDAIPVELGNDRNNVRKPFVVATILLADSLNRQERKDTVRVSPTRYMTYVGDYLYWIVTPKTTFDDFAVMKKEFEKQEHKMQLSEIKYDPLYAYINRISLTVKRPTGGMTNCGELNDDLKSISSIAGYVGIGRKLGGSGTGALKSYKTDFPESLRKMAAEEEASVNHFIKEHRIDYLLLDGERKFKELGNGASTYGKEYFKNKSTEGSGLIVNPNGSLSVKEELGAIKIFVNNEPATRESLGRKNVNQLYAVVKKTQYNPARKESFTSALLIYTIEDN
jgi:beta-lactamase regulating signal transducer with metallopeptidase domain